MAPDSDDDQAAAEEQLAALGPLFRPLSDAEIAKRRRMYSTEEAGTLDPVSLRFLIIMTQEGLA